MKSIKDIAQALCRDLSEEAIVRYINEQQRLMCNEQRYGRSIRLPLVRMRAGLLALDLKSMKKGA